MTPVPLAASMVLACNTVAVPELTLTVTLACVLIVAAESAVAISAAVPVRVVTAVAPTAAVVLESIVLRSLAAALPEATVVATATAVLIVVAEIALAISAAVPVRVVTAVATTLPIVIASTAFRSLAFTISVVTVAAAILTGFFARIEFNCTMVAELVRSWFNIVKASPLTQPIPAARLAAVPVTAFKIPL